MTDRKVEEVSLDAIQTTFFVRKKLDEDRVVQLALLMENGADIPPVWLTKEKVLVDGRHRVEAARLAGWKTIKCEIKENDGDKGDLIIEAFNANCGGSIPPTRADILFTIQQLLQQGWGVGRIVKHFPFPAAVTRRYVLDTQSKIRDARINQAVIQVRDRGFTLVEAARNCDVDEKAVREAMTKVSKKLAGAEQYKGNLTTRFRSVSRANAHLFQKLFDAYQEGEVSIDYVRDVMEHTQSLLAQSQRSYDGWRQRFAAVLSQERQVARGGAK